MKTDSRKKLFNNIPEFAKETVQILQTALSSFTETRASQASAALSYYTIFSLFPLLILIISVGSFFLDRPTVFNQLTQIIKDIIPLSSQLINENLNQVLKARGTIGIFSLVALLWSASNMFTNLVKNISLAWPESEERTFIKNRLIGLGMVIGLAALLVISLVLIGVTDLISLMEKENPLIDGNILRILSSLASWLFLLFLFWALYRWIPTKVVQTKVIMVGALIVSIAWEFTLWGFSWYLRSGFSQYQLIYGSIGAVVALLFLIYILSNITLFGAHLIAAQDDRDKQRGD
jgi:membrane protein